MEWLTTKEVNAAAKKSKRAAIACAKKHWKQNWQASEEEMRTFSNEGAAPVGGGFCALCRHYNVFCSRCPLSTRMNTCGKEYRLAATAFSNWKYRTGRYSTFTKAAKAMYDRICEL